MPPHDIETGRIAARLTLLTVIVSAIVGLGSAFLAYKSNQDTQDRAARDTRVQSDLSELRSVLDTALADLSVTRTSAETKRDAWLAFVENQDEGPVQTAQTALRASLMRTRADASRLRIRLGREGVYGVYWFAYRAFMEAGACMDPDDPRVVSAEDREEAVDFLVRNGVWLGDWFSDLAFASAQSTLSGALVGAPTTERLDEAKHIGSRPPEAVFRCGKALRLAEQDELPSDPGEYWSSV